VVYYRVSNATVSIANVENAHHSTRLLAQTTLRNTMGTRHLHEILSERMTISGTMQVSSKRLTVASWPGPPTSSLSLSKDSSDSVGLLPLIYLVYRHKEMYRENKTNQEETTSIYIITTNCL